ncbi:natural killer cells antigen CD94-like, partial [Emydura macquarii macquarii]|uniref:natural killer cells antigen CD94-like n=1 Tax=Emydura macquarii macquarii TaxID=1129001 RepID=UPI00352B0894
ILCPANWQWMGGDTCFYISALKKSWKESQNFCSSQNSTLLMLKARDKLIRTWNRFGNNLVICSQNHVPPRSERDYYWIGLHKSEENSWYWVDGSAFSTPKEDWIYLYSSYNCGYLYGVTIGNSYHCTKEHFFICEKAAVKL